jgi:hypothetical protein
MHSSNKSPRLEREVSRSDLMGLLQQFLRRRNPHGWVENFHSAFTEKKRAIKGQPQART